MICAIKNECHVRAAINSIHDELVATGAEGPDPQTSEARSPERLDRAAGERASGQKCPFVAEKKQDLPLQRLQVDFHRPMMS